MPQDQDYATPERLAIYLEKGWSDYLFGTAADGSDGGAPDPLRRRVPPAFPIAVAELARTWAETVSLAPRSVCDVGGATGRLLFELDRRFAGLERLELVEPSARFCQWAERLLASSAELPAVPTPGAPGSPVAVDPRGRPPPLAGAERRLKIFNRPLEDHRAEGGYDLLACLNVVDRHPDPRALVARLGGLLREGGLLLMSCPFDFDETVTPNPETWIEDLNELFAGVPGWRHVGQEELFYEYRSHRRSWTRLAAQVVAKLRDA